MTSPQFQFNCFFSLSLLFPSLRSANACKYLTYIAIMSELPPTRWQIWLEKLQTLGFLCHKSEFQGMVRLETSVLKMFLHLEAWSLFSWEWLGQKPLFSRVPPLTARQSVLRIARLKISVPPQRQPVCSSKNSQVRNLCSQMFLHLEATSLFCW